jgi:hypothetical protein
MLTAQGWENRNGGAYVLCAGQLILATDVVLGEAAHNAMLLSQGAERAIEMRQDERAAAGTAEPPAQVRG